MGPLEGGEVGRNDGVKDGRCVGDEVLSTLYDDQKRLI